MSTNEKDVSTLALSGVIVLVAALGGYLWYQAPLKSSRPANPGLERHEAVVAQRALARLWQDPLAAVDEHIKTQTAKRSTAVTRGWKDLADEIIAKLAVSSIRQSDRWTHHLAQIDQMLRDIEGLRPRRLRPLDAAACLPSTPPSIRRL